MSEFYQMQWGNGCTDVWASLEDALQDWRNSNTADDPEYGKAIEDHGQETDEPSAGVVIAQDGTEMGGAEWSEVAKAKALAEGIDWKTGEVFEDED